MDRVDYRVLGQVRFGKDAGPVAGQRPRDVLALLLTRRPRPLAPDVILEAVWGKGAPGLDASVVHTVIARLRRTLGPSAIQRSDLGYHIPEHARVDADEFARLVTRAASLAPEHGAESLTLLRAALELWSGPESYAGVSDDLVTAERPRLHELRDAAIEQLAECLLATGSPAALAESLSLTQELALREPLREHAHELLVESLYRLGRQADALAAYDRLRRVLRRELGIDPQPSLVTLHARILAQEDLTPEGPRRATARPRTILPARPRTALIGRTSELAALSGLFDSGRALISVIGPGGVGKSRLLAEFAAGLDVDLTTYLELPASGATTAAEVAEGIARARGLSLGGEDPVPALAGALRSTALVILIDEAEWAPDAVAEVVNQLTRACPHVRVVLTSRIPLRLTGESLLSVAPLSTPPSTDAGDLARWPAVRLLIDRLADHAPDLVLSEDDIRRIAEIARRVDGLPLALEIVAGQAHSSSVPDLLAMVDLPLDLPAAEHDRAPRQRSLRDTLLWSVERLSPAARMVLGRLSVFAGTFELSAAVAVAGAHHGTAAGRGATDVPDVATVIRGLIREAHVQVERRDGQLRLRLLRTVQSLASELLEETGEVEEVRRRHREWFASRWRDRPLDDALIAEVATSYADHVAALANALEASDRSTCGDLAIALSRYWFFVETGSAGLRWVRAVLARDLVTPRQRAILRMMTVALRPQDHGPDQRAALDDLIAELADDPDWLGRLHILRSVGPYLHGDFARALACSRDAVAVARARAPHHLPEALGAYAVMLAALGRADEAASASAEAWTLIRDAPSATDLTQVVPKVGLALIDSGHARQALDVLRSALETVERKLPVTPPTLFTINAGWAALGCGESGQALHWFARSLDHVAAGGDLVVMGELLAGAGAALAGMRDPAAAEVLHTATAQLAAADAVLTPWQDAQVRHHAAAAKVTLGAPVHVLAPPLDLARVATLISSAATRLDGEAVRWSDAVARPSPAQSADDGPDQPFSRAERNMTTLDRPQDLAVLTEPSSASSIASEPRLPGST